MTMTDRYSPRDRVRVFLRGDDRDGDAGRVAWSYADCDEMVHVVEFPDGARGRYLTHELLGHGVIPPFRRPPRPPSPPRPLVRRGPDPELDLPPAAAGNEPQED